MDCNLSLCDRGHYEKKTDSTKTLYEVLQVSSIIIMVKEFKYQLLDKPDLQNFKELMFE